jgi:hypothetical protein
MISKSKLAVVAAVVAMGIASPALAQSSGTWSAGISTRNGRPNVQTESTNFQNDKITVRQSGLRAFAMVPGGAQSGSTYNPATSGYDPGIETQR